MTQFSHNEILDRISDGIVSLDTSYTILYINLQVKRYMLHSHKNVVGKSLFSAFPALKKSKLEKIFQKVIKNNNVEKYEYTDPSEVFTFEASIYPDSKGLVIFFRDISARVKLKKELEQSRIQLKLLLDKTTDIVEIIDEKGEIKYISKSTTSIAGYHPREVIGKSIFSFLDTQDTTRIKKYLQNILQDPGKQVVVQVKVKHKNGNSIWLQVIATNMLQDPNINGIIINMRDITQRKTAEESLFYYAALSRSIGDAVISMDLNGKIVTWNKGAEHVYGWSAKQVTGKDVIKILDGVSDRGIPITDYISKNWEEAIKKEGIWIGIIRQTTKHGEIKDIQSSITYIKNDEGENIGFIAVCRDITQLKNLERNKDRFIGMASHELKTPITSALLFTQVLEKRFMKIHDIESQKLLHKMIANLSKLNSLVADLLDVSKLQQKKFTLKKQGFILNYLVKEIIEDLQPISEHKIILRSKLKVEITADKEKIRQVITNLITNAIKYDSTQKPIIITIEQKNDKVVLTVKDFGIGISKKDMSKIFNQFYQVGNEQKNTYPGLGLGLYISLEIIRLHEGEMWVKSQLGKGSKFSFSIPS